MKKYLFLVFLSLITVAFYGQLPVGRDTICVVENGYTLKMPWANGINHANFSNIDLNFDGKKDVVAFDRLNGFGTGRFRCFINTGTPGNVKYEPCLECSYYFPPIVSHWALLYDYNCDGREDIFCSTSGGIKVYKNTSVSPILSFTLVKPLIYADINPNGVPVMANLYTSSTGLPGIGDVDNDGDLDVLTFSPAGNLVQYYRNLAMETYSTCANDSLLFELSDNCWGKFSEASCSVNFNQQCGAFKNAVDPASKTYDSGAALTIFDSDNDRDKDLILGDITCNTVRYLHNTGDSLNPLITDSTKLYPNFPDKNNTTQINMNKFPCAYFLDVDGDNKKDLIAAPNLSGRENTKSVWYYHNTSPTNTVNFQFVKNNFLQEDMVEVGQNSFPVLLDYDADGRKDLLIGTFGYFMDNSLMSRLTLYRNTGTLSQPAFSLITRDYAGLSTYSLNGIMPAVGDVDKDGDVDILIGTSGGHIHWLKNTAGGGNPCNFSSFITSAFSFTTANVVAAPQLFDIDLDNDLDLLIGTKNGRIAYYKNTGSGTPFVPGFSLVTNFFGGVDVKGNSSLFGLDGYAVPFFYNDNAGMKLLVGSVSGALFYYDVPADISTPCTLITAPANSFNEGVQSAPCFEDINDDGKRDLILGNAGGGLTYFSSTSTVVSVSNVSQDQLSLIKIYPNPCDGFLTVQTDSDNAEHTSVIFYDIFGSEILSTEFNSNMDTIDIRTLKAGVYFVKVTANSKKDPASCIKKIIKQ